MYKENYFKAKDQLSLFYREWKVDDANENVVLVHGYTDHSGRYEKLANYFNEKKINVFCFDLRGHGQSEGERTSINSFNEYVDDLKEFINYLNLKTPFYLLGHSMGGLISINYALKRTNSLIKGLILSAPSLIQNASASPLKIKLVLFLSTLFPKKRTKIKINSKYLSSKKEVIDVYNNDPLVFNIGAKMKFLGELMRAMNSIPLSISDLNIPVIIFHDKDDKLSNFAGSELLIKECKSEDKRLDVLTNRGHELLQGEESTIIMDNIVVWISKKKL